MTRLRRRRRTPPFWEQLWQRLSSHQQHRIKCIGWSASVHLLLLALLALSPLGIRTLTTISFTASIAEAEAVEAFTLTELEAPVIEELALSAEIETPDVLELEEIIEPLVMDMSLESELVGDLPTPSSISELTTDAQRIAEADRRVAAAGGSLEGPIRVSLIFSGDDDIDLHVKYTIFARPGQFVGFGERHIWFNSPFSEHAALDVDANAQEIVDHPCENVIFHTVPPRANYIVAIHHFKARGKIEPTPYVVTIKYGKKIQVIEGTILPSDGFKTILQFRYDDK